MMGVSIGIFIGFNIFWGCFWGLVILRVLGSFGLFLRFVKVVVVLGPWHLFNGHE